MVTKPIELKSLHFNRVVLSCVIAALLAGCGVLPFDSAQGRLAQDDTQPPMGAMPQSRVVATHDRNGSWMLPKAKAEDLVYVTNVYTVSVYSYPRGKLVRTLQGFSGPAGECVDGKQDVYITNLNTGQIFEYAHGGKTPIATLKSPGADPAGCSIDPTTGDLAVSSLGFGRRGSVGIFKGARGAPKIYRDAAFQRYFYCGYDAAGNLFVDGENSTAGFEFAELAKHDIRLKTVNLDDRIGFPGGVQWDGKYVAIGDQSSPVVRRFAISQDYGTEVGVTTLGGSDVTDISQFFITGGRLLAPNQCKGSCTGNVLYYHYPAGGSPTKTIANGVRYPHGVVVSKAPM